MIKNLKLNNRGFTLVELLVVIALLGILATIGLVTFSSAQLRGRDTQRKSDLKQISSALELYYSDHGGYPASDNGKIKGCPSTLGTDCTWGSNDSKSLFTDGQTVYFKSIPKDPTGTYNYYYRSLEVDGKSNMGFQLYAHLENSQDPNCLPDRNNNPNCTSPTNPQKDLCGGASTCNFAVTSPNTTASE